MEIKGERGELPAPFPTERRTPKHRVQESRLREK